MTSNKKIRVAIVGLGFGAEFIPIFQRHPNAEMYAICRRDRKELDAVGDRFGVAKRYTSYEELLKDPDAYSPGDLALITLVKIVALVVAASAAFRGGRVFPATFIGVAIGMFAAAVIPGFPLALAVACGIIGMLLVAARDGWISLFIAAAVSGDIGLLPYLCVIILPAWLLVSRAPELRVIPKKPSDEEPHAEAAPRRRGSRRPAPEGEGDTA